MSQLSTGAAAGAPNLPPTLQKQFDRNRPIHDVSAKQTAHVSIGALGTLVSFYFCSMPIAIVFTCGILTAEMYNWPTAKKVCDVFKPFQRTESKGGAKVTPFDGIRSGYYDNEAVYTTLFTKVCGVNAGVAQKKTKEGGEIVSKPIKSPFIEYVQETIFKEPTLMDGEKFHELLERAASYGVMNIVEELQTQGILDKNGCVADGNPHQKIASGVWNGNILSEEAHLPKNLQSKQGELQEILDGLRKAYKEQFATNLDDEFAIGYNVPQRNNEWNDIEEAGNAGMWQHHFFAIGKNQKWNRSNVLFVFFDEKGNLTRKSVEAGKTFLQKVEFINSRFGPAVHGEGNYQTLFHPFPKNSIATLHGHGVKILDVEPQPSLLVQQVKNLKFTAAVAVGDKLLESL